jgi:hypothetical protein
LKLQPKKILAGLLLLLVLGCKRGDKLPDDIIPTEQMSSILADLQIAESTVARMNLKSYDSSKVAFQYKQQQILDSYSVDSSLYNRSYEAYARYPVYMEEIYTDVLKILEIKTDSVRLKDRQSRSDENPPS